MRRDPTYWNDVTHELLRAAWRRLPTDYQPPVPTGFDERFYELIDAANHAIRIHDRMERQHARPH